MQLSLQWLQKYIPGFELNDLPSFKNRLDTRLSEVEQVEMRGRELENLVVGEIVSVEAHPQSSKLSVCQVDVGRGQTLQIVCGAPNVRAGLRSVVCLPGGQVYVPGQREMLKIQSRAVAGVESQGMMCAPDELGIYDSHAQIIEIDHSLATGTDVTEQFRDVVIEIENKALPHRPDVFSHLGIARELSVIFKTELEQKEWEMPTKHAEEDLDIRITNRIQDLVPRFTAVALSNIHVGPSPLWLQIKLAYAGIRPVNNVVDITNYVMHDMGQPLHAYDLQKLTGQELIVRAASKDEVIETLDHQKRSLPAGAIVITDKEKPVSIAGIMGGVSTEVSETTEQVLLEAANFEMYSIRRTSRQLGLRTEGVTRFEKGIDPNITYAAICQAAQLIVDICGAEVCSAVQDVYPQPLQPKVVRFDLGMPKRVLGVEIDKNKIINILDAYGYSIEGLERIPAAAFTRSDFTTEVDVVVPTWRKDIHAGIDIVEDIGRSYGYEHIPLSLPKRDLTAPTPNKFLEFTQNIKNVMTAAGLTEVYTYSMVGAEVYRKTNLDSSKLYDILDPVSPELAYVRSEVVPSLLDKVLINAAKYTDFGLMEISRVLSSERSSGDIPVQPYKLAAVRVGVNEVEVYRKLKYALEQLSHGVFGNEISIKPSTNVASFLHLNKSGHVLLGGEKIGEIGIIHPVVADQFGLSGLSVAILNLNIDPMFAYKVPEMTFVAPSVYPPVLRDISFWQADKTYVADVISSLKALKLSLLQEVAVVDIYEEKGKRSVTMRCVLQANDHTLQPDEIATVLEQVSGAISKLGHQIR